MDVKRERMYDSPERDHSPVATGPRAGLARLREAAENGELAELAQRFNIQLITVFGSAIRDEEDPRDLDVAVFFAPNKKGDFLGVLSALVDLTCAGDIDLMDLKRATVVGRYHALVLGEPLYEATRGLYARAQMGAAGCYVEARRNAKLELELLAEGRG